MIFCKSINKTILGLVANSGKENVEKIAVKMKSNLTIVTFLNVIIVWTTLLTRGLQRRAKWRQSSTTTLHTGVSNGISILTELLNSSFKIFIYYGMSIVYRETFIVFSAFTNTNKISKILLSNKSHWNGRSLFPRILISTNICLVSGSLFLSSVTV